jgi:hypothetical protein
VEEGETAPLLHITSPERTGRPRNQIAELDAHNFFIKDIARMRRFERHEGSQTTGSAEDSSGSLD